MFELYDLMEELNTLIYDESDIGEFHSNFVYSSAGGRESISLEVEDGEVFLLDDDTDRGWNEDTDDYERTNKEQIALELEVYINRLTKILNKLKETK